jgi:hypothetical protein
MPSWLGGSRAAAASADLAAACGSNGSDAPTSLGIEHEFLVRDHAGRPVDFRTVVHGLDLGRRDLVATYGNSYRLPTGSIVTADGTEAEIATPPIELGPGAIATIDAWAAWERRSLAERVSPLTLRGDSTHINVSLPTDVDPDVVAWAFATRFSVGLMLLMDRPESPGLIVRPRPHRLELGGEFCVGSALRAALAYAVGATHACVAFARGTTPAAWPPEIATTLERHVLRYGWYVARTAVGDGDLYRAGRRLVLRTATGRRLSAGDALAGSWKSARAQLEPLVGIGDLADGDALVGAAVGLPIERIPGDFESDVSAAKPPASPFGDALPDRPRPLFDLAPVMLNWELAVFLVSRPDRRRSAFIAVPARRLEQFLRLLDAGEIDEPIDRYLSGRSGRRRLVTRSQAREVGMFDALGLRATLLEPERDYWGQRFDLVATRRRRFWQVA